MSKSLWQRSPVYRFTCRTMSPCWTKPELFATIYLSPGVPTVVNQEAACTNHQDGLGWSEYATMTRTRERKAFLDAALNDPMETRESMLKKFFRPPLFHTKYEKAFGTLYTAQYDVMAGEIQVLWLDKILHQSFDHFTEGNLLINLGKHISGKIS